eukprot:scaffold186698_cov55-Attheya_sp.AAC.2
MSATSSTVTPRSQTMMGLQHPGGASTCTADHESVHSVSRQSHRSVGSTTSRSNSHKQQQQQQQPGPVAVASSWASVSASSPVRRSVRTGTGTGTGTGTTAASAMATTATHEEAEATARQQQHAHAGNTILSAAGMASLSLLKLAGGVTLTATGNLVAPPLHVTKNVLLPALYEMGKDYVTSVTPIRVQDWCRIGTKSIHQFFSVMVWGDTPEGNRFRSRLSTVITDDLVEVVSCDKGRQVLVDSVGAVVKLADALGTPQVKALLEHVAVLTCRIADAASTPAAKQLYHNLPEAIWAFFELAADPHTTLALAEVTAYLCHALEMEHVLHRPAERRQLSAQNQKFIRLKRKRRARQRHERNRHHRATYLDPVMLHDADDGIDAPTVEQVILSSMGNGTHLHSSNPGTRLDDETHETNHTNDANNWLPTRVYVQEENSGHHSVTPGDPSNLSNSGVEEEEAQKGGTNLTQAMDDDHTSEREMIEMARDSCNVDFLRDEIAARSNRLERAAIAMDSQRQKELDDENDSDSDNQVDDEDIVSIQGANNAVPQHAIVMNGDAIKNNHDTVIQNAYANNEYTEDPSSLASRANEVHDGYKNKIVDIDDNRQNEMTIPESYVIKSSGKMNELSSGAKMNRTKGRATSWFRLSKQKVKHSVVRTPSLHYEDENSEEGDSKDVKVCVTKSQDDKTNMVLDNQEDLPDRSWGERFPRKDHESAVSQFYRALDGIMDDTRCKTVDSLLQKQSKSQEDGDAVWHSRAAAAAGAGNEHCQDTLRKRLGQVNVKLKDNAKIGVGSSIPSSSLNTGADRSVQRSWVEAAMERYKLAFGILLCFFIVAIIAWFGLGAYGLYVLIRGPSFTVPSQHNYDGTTNGNQQAPHVVVKVIREIVHVTADGSIIPQHGNNYWKETTDELEDSIVQAVAKSYQESGNIQRDVAECIDKLGTTCSGER